MNVKPTSEYHDANIKYLMASVAVIQEILLSSTTENSNKSHSLKVEQAKLELMAARSAKPSRSPLDELALAFNLSDFERDILLLCVGMELQPNFDSLCAEAQGDRQLSYPTFSLAMSMLPAAHWSALAPHNPLRRWQLIEVVRGKTLTLSPLRINERILHYLVGIDYLDEPLRGIIEPLAVNEDLVPSQQEIAQKIAAILTKYMTNYQFSIPSYPILQLVGSEVASKKAIAQAAADRAGMKIAVMSANAVPTNTAELNNIILLWQREARLNKSVLLIDCDEWDSNDAAKENVARYQTIQNINTPLIITSRDRHRAGSRSLITFEVSKPTKEEQLAIWSNALGDIAPSLNGQVETLVTQFNLSAPSIHAVCTEAISAASRQPSVENGVRSTTDNRQLTPLLWNICRAQARPHLDELAQRIQPAATWDDLVLPEPQLQVLKEIAAHVRQRSKVYSQWGFAKKGGRGLGISALLAGSSGTGKTMSAEVLAGGLQLDLYRIDLSSVVSKYIGETEKNLRRIFDAAESGATILLFDEADAIFGKRSDVKDSHDRYANMEVSYLLQRMEAYQGLAILTTNLKDAIDTAFLRRIRFVVKYQFPDAQQRAEIWRRIFPKDTPTEGLDFNKLARLNVAGGNIRNIALNAAFMAADAGESVMMKHLLEAAKSEYIKLERALTDTEVKGWV